MEIPTQEELESRINDDIAHFEGVLPERNAIAWLGYISALLEWGLITVQIHDYLCKLLPQISEPNPVVDIMLGRGNEEPEEE